MTVSQVRTLTAEDVSATAQVLSQAFLDNPCYSFMHPRERTRAFDLRQFFERSLAFHLPLGLTWVACLPDGKIAGTATLEPPGGVPGSTLWMLRHWVLPTLSKQGARTVGRMVFTDGEFKRAYRGMTRGTPYWHVHAVAVAPGYQGTGLGGLLLGHLSEQLGALLRQRPAPVVLSTQRERNLQFYRRFGFVFEKQASMGRLPGEPGYTSWFMQRAR